VYAGSLLMHKSMISRDAERRRKELQYDILSVWLQQPKERMMRLTVIVASHSLIESSKLCRGETLVVLISKELALQSVSF
jgi:hypothetical protein